MPQSVDLRQVGELRVRSFRFGIDLGRALGNSAELRAGLESEEGSSRVRIGESDTPPEDFRTREFFLRYSLDRLDNVAFPRRGHALVTEWRRTQEDNFDYRNSDALQFDWRVARSWGRNTALVWATAGTLLDPQFAGERSDFTLGGFLNLSGLPRYALNGPHFGIARLDLLPQGRQRRRGIPERADVRGRVARGRQRLAVTRRHGPRFRAQGRERVHRPRHRSSDPHSCRLATTRRVKAPSTCRSAAASSEAGADAREPQASPRLAARFSTFVYSSVGASCGRE